MSIEDLEQLLYDMYQMDVYMPPLFGKWKDEFENISYSLWAVDELKDYIAQRIYPRTYGSIEELCNLTHEFMVKMTRYSRMNPNTYWIFYCAESMAAAIMELLCAMK